eukprot:3168725-Rhodomonas_salina.1
MHDQASKRTMEQSATACNAFKTTAATTPTGGSPPFPRLSDLDATNPPGPAACAAACPACLTASRSPLASRRSSRVDMSMLRLVPRLATSLIKSRSSETDRDGDRDPAA